MGMRYIVCYRLHRKNARRKELYRENFENERMAIESFRKYCQMHFDEIKKRDFELLTGDWKHIAYYNTDGLYTEPMEKFTPTIDKYKGSAEIVRLFFGMSDSMQKAIKDIMLVTQEEYK